MNILLAILLSLTILPSYAEEEEVLQPSHEATNKTTVMRSFDQARVDALVDAINAEIHAQKFQRARLIPIAAKQGNTKACNLMGWMFDNGVGVRKDPKKASIWFQSCASRDALASYNLGVLYQDGRGVTKDIDMAAKLFKQSWALGSVVMHSSLHQIPIILAYYHRKLNNHEEAFRWANRAAVSNAEFGKFLVAKMLLDNSAPTTDDVTAKDYLFASVRAYSGQAANLLAWCYGTGRLSDKDYVLAHQYELIAGKIDPKLISGGMFKWGGMLNEEEKRKATSLAEQWMSTHARPPKLDFKSTLSGIEPQFKS